MTFFLRIAPFAFTTDSRRRTMGTVRKLLWVLLALNLGAAVVAMFAPALALAFALLSSTDVGFALWRWRPVEQVPSRTELSVSAPSAPSSAEFAAPTTSSASVAVSAPGSAPSSLAAVTRGVETQYELLEKLAAGSMGEVYLARHRQLGREVALKRIKSGTIDKEDMARFEREARALSRLRSPHTVEVQQIRRRSCGYLCARSRCLLAAHRAPLIQRDLDDAHAARPFERRTSEELGAQPLCHPSRAR